MTDLDHLPGAARYRVRVLAAAYAISSYGSFLNLVALGLFAFEVTGSGLATGLFMALRLGSGFLAAPIAGVLATRYPRRPLMIGSDLLSAAALIALVAAPSAAEPVLLYGLALVLGATQAQWGVAMRSAVPDLVGLDGRTRANSQLVTARSMAMLAGFASAGVLVSQLGFHRTFLVDAASYVVCAALLLAVPLDRAVAAPRSGSGLAGAEPGQRPGGRPAAEPGEGRSAGGRLGVLRILPAVLVAMVVVRTADAFGSASHNVGLPVYANLAAPADPAAFAATFLTAWAVGSLAAGGWLGRRARTRELARPEPVFGLATCLMSVFFVLCFTGPPVWLLVPLAAAAGAADGIAEITYTGRLQGVPDEQRARVFGSAIAAQNAGFGLGMVGCSMLLDVLGPFPVVAAAHTAALATAAGFLVLFARAGSARAGPTRAELPDHSPAGSRLPTPR
ncbi:MAG TPA: MFS transporter [Micromonosporaceae bacterium]|nr:MFS transporter [Micromonosporaceae bacterium]